MIVGAGGFGREAAWTLERINSSEPAWELLGFADDAPSLATGTLEGYPLLGPVAQASRDHPGAAVFIAIGDNDVRERLYRQLRGHDFPALIDPSADVAPTVEMRHGVFIGQQAVVSVGAELGKFAIVCSRAGVGHDTKMGDFSMLRPAATLLGHMSVGARAYIAAGVVVRHDVGEGETLSGN
jgi:sugar O-acyltransferase (sialic acid O-acetyltransferase NeuD family)